MPGTTINQICLGLSGSTGTGTFVGNSSPTISSPTLSSPVLGTPTSGDMRNCTGLYWGSTTAGSIVMQSAVGQITAAQIKAINSTPISVIAAPGANLAILVINCTTYYAYTAPVYTAASAQTVRLGYGTGVSPILINIVISNASFTTTSNRVSGTVITPIASATLSSVVNTAIYFKNPVATEVTAGNSVFNYNIQYVTIDVTQV